MPQSSAIYFALTNNGDVLYVGQAVQLRRRWGRHHRTAALKALQCTTIAWLACAPKQLLELEDQFIKRFRPMLNIKRATSRLRYDLYGDTLHDLHGELTRVFNKFYGLATQKDV